MKTSHQYDQGTGCQVTVTASELNAQTAAQRLAGIDFTNGVFNMKGHGLSGLDQAAYRIEYKRLKGVKVFSFQ